MKTDYNISLLNNNTLIDLYIEPNEERYDEEDFNLGWFNLTWNITSFKDNALNIKVDFIDPIHISTASE